MTGISRRGWLAAVLAAASRPVLSRQPDEYERSILEWRRERLARLTAEDGWLTLVGLHWLRDGPNRAGSGASSDVRLPATAPPALGVFTPEGEAVRFEGAPGVAVRLRGREVRSAVLTPGGDPIEAGSLDILVIRRGGRLALRVRDRNHPARREFRGLRYFPIDPAYRLDARFHAYDPPRMVPIVNVLGDEIEWVNPGRLEFELHGATHRLETLLEAPDAKELFVIFRDRTSGQTTYPAGRYLYTPLPSGGRVALDFNRAYNPPCAFTEYATCPLPPRQNWLRTAIEAGEMAYEH